MSETDPRGNEVASGDDGERTGPHGREDDRPGTDAGAPQLPPLPPIPAHIAAARPAPRQREPEPALSPEPEDAGRESEPGREAEPERESDAAERLAEQDVAEREAAAERESAPGELPPAPEPELDDPLSASEADDRGAEFASEGGERPERDDPPAELGLDDRAAQPEVDDPDAESGDRTTEPGSDRVTEPAADSIPGPIPVPETPTPEPSPVPGPVPPPVPDPSPAPEPSPAPVPDPEPAPGPEPEPEPEPVSDSVAPADEPEAAAAPTPEPDAADEPEAAATPAPAPELAAPGPDSAEPADGPEPEHPPIFRSHDAKPGARDRDLTADAVALAERWIAEASHVEPDPAAARLAGVLQDPNGLPFTLGFVDGVMRPESLTAAASSLNRIAPLVPAFLPWQLRAAVRVGGAVAPVLPWPVVPIARRVLRSMVGHLIADARPNKLGETIARLKGQGARLNLNLLGEAVLGEREAKRRLQGIRDLVAREDVDYVSVKVSAVASHLSMWAFDELVDRVVERLRPLYVEAAQSGTFVNLDMEEYRDLDLTVAVFRRLLDDPQLRRVMAGIVLQAYLPDALPVLRELTAWAQERVDSGGAPIKIRLVKGANLPMERVDARIHGWAPATYDSKLDTDANYLRCLDEALHVENTRAVRVGVAGHNLYDLAYAWIRAGERGVREYIDFEMLLGMAQGQMQAVSREVGDVLLYVPVVQPAEFDVAISYLVRRLEENASEENFLSAAFRLADDPSLLQRERDRFAASAKRAKDPGLLTGARREQDRTTDEPVPAAEAPEQDQGHLTEAVLGIARSASADTGDVPGSGPEVRRFGGDEYVETAVYARQETPATGGGAPGFRNIPDTDPSLSVNRRWGREILARMPASTLGEREIRAARLGDPAELDRVVARVKEAAAGWGSRPAAERSAVLERAAMQLQARRAELIEVAGSETGKVIAESDAEVSEAIDFAAYYAANARELDGISGAVFVPSRVTVVTPPWNFPIAIPAGGVLAALAAGSGVVFKPAPQARRCAAVIAEALWQAGVPRELLALVDVDEGELGRRLVTHPGVDRVILTGSWDTAALFRSWRPDLPLHAETSGKNAMIVTSTADMDLAASDLVRSAFSHAGQKCSAASLTILVGSVGRSRRFARQLIDATRSLRVGAPSDPLAEIGPVIAAPEGKLEWALTTLDDGESWLVQPRPLPGGEGRYWTPGIRTGVRAGSRFHLEEFFGPVMGVMHAPTLSEAIRMQNAVAYGLTAGLYTQSPEDLELWLDEVEAGNLYVNRGMTGAIVQRQPFGGWKRSSVGAGSKAGGPNYLIGLGTWRPSGSGGAGRSLHLRGLDTRIASIIEAAQPTLAYEEFEWLRRAALSDAIAWDREFGRVKDVTGLGAERNLFRYRPVPVGIRATHDAPWQAVLRVLLAALRTGGRFALSTPVGMPASVRAELSELDVEVHVESDREWIARMTSTEPEPLPVPGGLGAPPETPASGTPEEPASAEGAGEQTDGALAQAGVVDLLREPLGRPPRVRLVGPPETVRNLHLRLAEAAAGDPDLAIYASEVTTAGRIELLPFLREQAISITAHRFGTPDDWSAGVI